ncbi:MULTISPECIES: threonine-phosphate decarboxylase [unclassified Lentimonas]|uniref:threonine-phosphate decarboxylase n=1 Tax=unclassified Lentimonas TaxID=2630993 RepID=UPI001321404A|nr:MULTISPECIES: threonine-phosphate decarboxylase [unclassified Lentimonas]CAA6679506.1 Unannotated [Lentimonas sp. CC4]CAA6687177.1 Unannotated [Lentimonas sp. CC6]CAA7075476.1 Unannotated [Lentimonas sp. CC4]CAA7170242.1 Unannotated [Lentimonas sp. CC21]CAA7182537.1 Unannotated [Lentimonas sp. CC8]
MSQTVEDQKDAHGGTPSVLFQRYGIEPRSVIDFSVNLSPLELPESILALWNQLPQRIAHYPSTDGAGVKAYYAQRFGLDADCVIAGNGSLELMYFLQRVQRYQHVLVPQPAFHDYQRSACAGGAQVHSCQRPLGQDYDAFLCSAPFREALAKVDAVFLGSPNNPDGATASADCILDLCAQYPNTHFLIDQAFIQFLPIPGRASLLNPQHLRPNLFVFHSLTKYYAIAGLRIGSLIADPESIRALSQVREPWSVNSVAETIATELATCSTYDTALRAWLATESQHFDAALSKIPGIQLYPSATNFRLLRLNDPSQYDQVLTELLQQGQHVRCCKNFPGLPAGCFRIGFQAHDANQALVAALQKSVS